MILDLKSRSLILEVYVKRYRYLSDSQNKSDFRIYSLVFAWSFGLSCGMLFASIAEPYYLYSRMCVIQFLDVSISGLLISMLFPFLLSMFAIRFHITWPIFIFALLKSFIYCLSRCTFIYIYSGAGWLVNGLLFFSDTIVSFLLLWYWICAFSQIGKWNPRICLEFCIGAFFVCLFDYCFVLPTLTEVLA